MAKMTPRTLSGFMELLPAPQQQMERIMEVLRKTYSLYGFTPLDTPVIESSEVLLAKGGGETEKQIYRFQKGDSDLALRFDLTVPLAKYVALHYGELSFPFRRYQIGKVYRGERAQRGRHRQRRDAPAHGRHALVVHVFEQTLRRHEKFLRDDGRRRAEAQRQINVAHSGDVVQRRLVAKHVLAHDAHHAGVVLDVAHERVLRRDDALGRAGRAGGEDDVQRVELARARGSLPAARRPRSPRAGPPR